MPAGVRSHEELARRGYKSMGLTRASVPERFSVGALLNLALAPYFLVERLIRSDSIVKVIGL